MGTLNSNEAINAIRAFGRETGLTSGFHAIKEGYKNGHQYKQAFKETFYHNVNGKDELNMAKAAAGAVGGMIGLRAGMGALRGTFTDGNGQFDAPGIPFI